MGGATDYIRPPLGMTGGGDGRNETCAEHLNQMNDSMDGD